MRRILQSMAMLGLLIGAAGRVEAAPIVYTVTGTGSGIFGGTSFDDALVTVTFTGDTATVADEGGGFFANRTGVATISVAGVGTGTLIGEPFAYDNQALEFAGIADNLQGGTILATKNAAFATYDLTTSIGPLSGEPFIRTDLTFTTTFGDFRWRSITGDSTFVASTGTRVVPEPSTLALAGIGGLALAGVLRRGKRRG
jgi:hypothetical protein